MKTGSRFKRVPIVVAYSFIIGVLLTSVYGQIRPAATSAATCQSIAIPAYSYPNPPTFWNGAIGAHPPVSIMIANVNSGPGTTQDSNYVSVINKAAAAGIKVLGYVWTNYGASSTASVEADIDTWKSLYGVKSILFDGTSSAAGDESYYQTLTNYVHANSGIVMLNPGTVPDEGYMNIGDIVSIFEGTEADYNSYTPPAWAKNYTSKIANIIFSVPNATAMQSVLTTSQKDNAGYVYITDEGLPNPYSTLPAYWSSETSQINQNCTPASSPPSSGSGGSSSGKTTKKNTGTTSKATATTPTTAATTVPTPAKTTTPTTASTAGDTKTTAKGNASPQKVTSQTTGFKWGAMPIAVVGIVGIAVLLLLWRLLPLLARHARGPAMLRR